MPLTKRVEISEDFGITQVEEEDERHDEVQRHSEVLLPPPVEACRVWLLVYSVIVSSNIWRAEEVAGIVMDLTIYSICGRVASLSKDETFEIFYRGICEEVLDINMDRRHKGD